jgi:hypothetical protein
MATMECFDTILNWKLKRGSHTFPGQDGGSRINQAAIVAAGFRYQPIQSVKSMPECFSRPIWVLCEDQELVRNERGDRVCQLTLEERWVEAGLRVGMTVHWNEPQTELLRRLWLARETARTVVEKLGGSVTRNAVIGKAHRLGLTGKQGSKSESLSVVGCLLA